MLKYAVLALPYSGAMEGNGHALLLKHPAYAWLGVRPFIAQHTRQEHNALERWATGCARVAEIGVAEGVSAVALRENMSPQGTLYLIDPFHMSRIRSLNFTRRAAHRAVNGSQGANVVWIEKFSSDAVRNWNGRLDLLLIDGDHSEEGVRKDWQEWSPFVASGGIVMFHDARPFEGGWTNPGYGPVKVVNELFRRGAIPGWKIVEEVHSLVVIQRCS